MFAGKLQCRWEEVQQKEEASGVNGREECLHILLWAAWGVILTSECFL